MILVGIDTGVHTGVAIWNTRENYFKMIMPTHAMSKKLKTLPTWQLLFSFFSSV